MAEVLPEDALPKLVFDELKRILPDLSFVDSLLSTINKSEFSSFKDLANDLKSASASVKSLDSTSTSAAAWLSNFVSYVTRDRAMVCYKIISEFKSGMEWEPKMEIIETKIDDKRLDSYRPLFLERAREFALMTTWARRTIAMVGTTYIPDGSTILVHGSSNMVLEVLKEASKMISFEVLCTDGLPSRTGIQFSSKLQEHNISSEILPVAACMMDKVGMVLVGANGVDQSGGIINQIGTLQIAVMARDAGIPVFVAAESFKFGARIPKEGTYDYTPHNYLTKFISDSGAFYPRFIKEEWNQLLYASHFPF